jgi:Family of unknown function (DUF6049)
MPARRPCRRVRSPRAGRTVLAGLAVGSLIFAFLAVTSPAATAGAGAVTASSRSASSSRVALVGQTSWVGPGQPFVMTLHLTSDIPLNDLELGVDVFSRLTSRTALDQSIQSRFEGGLMASVPFTPLRQLGVSQGQVTLQIPTDRRVRGGLDFAGCPTACDGVYPVRVQLGNSATGAVLDQLDTHLVYGTPLAASDKLDLALVLPVQAPTPARPEQLHHVGPAEAGSLVAMAQAFDQVPGLRASFVPNPATVQALATSARTQDKAALASLQHLVSVNSHELIAAPYVPVDASALAGAGLGDEIQAQLARGSQILAEDLGDRVSRATWVTTGPLDQTALDQVVADGYKQVVVPAGSLVAIQSKLSENTSPFVLTGRGGEPLATAVAADQGLAAHFVTDGDPVLAAHQFLADLALIYFDNPGAHGRAVVAQAPVGWTPDPAFLRTLLSGLTHPGSVASTVTLGDVFRLFGGSRPGPARHVVTSANGAAGLSATKIRSARQRLGAFSSVVGGTEPIVTELGDLVLASEAIDLRSASRDSYLSAFREGVNAQLALISLPADRTVTVTGQAARIPITVVSNAPYPVHAILGVASEQLSFPNGSTKPLVLVRHDNAEYFDVRTRSSGAFPLEVSLVSPQGQLVLVQARFTVRSTAVSGVAVLLSVGAALFLVVWWGRSVVRGRRERRRRLVPPAGG